MPLLRNGRTAGAVSRVQALDDPVDEWFERIRRPALDPLFYGLSSAADHGLLWLSIGALRAAWRGDPGDCAPPRRFDGSGVGADQRADQAVLPARPPRSTTPCLDEPLPYGMHRPISSSFPSGHAASAFTAAMLLSDSPLAPAYFVLAGSRRDEPCLREDAPRVRRAGRCGARRGDGRSRSSRAPAGLAGERH